MINSINRDFAAYRGKLAHIAAAVAAGNHLAAKAYERRNAPDLAETIGKIAEGFEAHKATVNDLRTRLERAETRMARPGSFTGTAPGAELDGSESKVAPPTAEERKAFGLLLRTGDKRYAVEARAAVNAGTSGQGLETVAAWFDDVVLRQARAAAPLLSIVRTRNVGNFPAKHIVGTNAGMGSGWTGEQAIRNDSDAPLPKAVEVPAGEWYALPSITEWALTDLNFKVEEWLQAELVDEYAETMQAAVVAGNGSDKPKGFLDGAPVTTADGPRAFGTLQYFASGLAGTLPTTTDAMLNLLLDIVHGLRWKHRQNASWVMSALTMSTLRKFKDTTGRPILLDSMITGQPATLLGYPLVECEMMPSIAANAIPVAFGDFDAGYVVDQDAAGMRITRDDITSKGFVKYYARRRVGGKVLDSEAIKLLKVAAS